MLYWDPAHDVAVAECGVRWIEDDDGRHEAWERLSAAPQPMGYDPAPIWPGGPEARTSWRSASTAALQAKSAAAMAPLV